MEKCPFIVLRLFRVAHEAYGRSFCEDLLGDLKSLEYLSKAIVEGSAAAAKIIFYVTQMELQDPMRWLELAMVLLWLAILMM